ncbi:hypothetical protein [Polymorphum gilvum]|uniref:DUF1127 domain-containing protein n=1 Tax=Polymorphum gilvum (strain LMG 25793 / CGMCC 1.9160 / SL003B-26A1) TaxID=991905 RepID=F2IYH7_POLGS|nr:hypothetical protein [Polymorphum gilvum]ADZ68490.1 hypothetical protein SL003B_0051 [Polymorphum gilvum SL003B-26A1]
MATQITLPASGTLAAALRAFGRGLFETLEAFGRARAAAALYEKFALLSDEELARLGLSRDDVTRTIAARLDGKH